MGGTGPSLLQDTGYPLQALEGALQGHAVANTLNKSIDNAGIHDGPNPCQSPFGNRTETTQVCRLITCLLSWNPRGFGPLSAASFLS